MKTYSLRTLGLSTLPPRRFWEEPTTATHGGTSQGDADKSQGEESTKKTDADDQGSDADKSERKEGEGDKYARENARRRRENEELKAQIAELSERLEATENEKLSDTERLQKERAKLERQAQEAAAEAKQAKKMLLATKAIAKHGLPEDFAERLLGDTEEELEEDAKRIATLIDRTAKEKYRPGAPQTEGGDRHNKQNGITDAERQRHQQQLARNW